MTIAARSLAALVAAALPDESLSAADLETCCYGSDTDILGDEYGAAVLTVRTFEPGMTTAWLLLIAVHPDDQRQGHGRRLVERAVEAARTAGAVDLHLGNAIPRFVWPGVDFRFTAALSLFEACGFDPYGAACNMTIPTTFRSAAPPGVAVSRETGDGAVELARHAYPHWVDEVARGTRRGTCFAAAADGDTVGFACHSVNRAGWIGPMATDPDRQHGGVGNALLGALCTDLAETGLGAGEIAWVGPVGFYAKAGARVSRVFRNARLTL